MRVAHLFDGELLAALGQELLDDVDDDLAAGLDAREALVREVVSQTLYQRRGKGQQDERRCVHAKAEGCMRHTPSREVVSERGKTYIVWHVA